MPVSFGDYVTANVYWPASYVTGKSPPLAAVVWLHPFSYATGYTAAYGQRSAWLDLVQAGFMVLAYDQVTWGRLFYC
jgi:hypothetical protein